MLYILFFILGGGFTYYFYDQIRTDDDKALADEALLAKDELELFIIKNELLLSLTILKVRFTKYCMIKLNV